MAKISQRHANRVALLTAAALIESNDLAELFADLYDDNCNDNDAVEVLDKAKNYAVARIRKLVADK
jgi:hypothetical protein